MLGVNGRNERQQHQTTAISLNECVPIHGSPLTIFYKRSHVFIESLGLFFFFWSEPMYSKTPCSHRFQKMNSCENFSLIWEKTLFGPCEQITQFVLSMVFLESKKRHFLFKYSLVHFFLLHPSFFCEMIQ